MTHQLERLRTLSLTVTLALALAVPALACGLPTSPGGSTVPPTPTATPTTPPTNPFVGTWESTDIDGSHQTLTIGGADGAHVSYHDDLATVCGGDPAEAIGIGSISGATLTVELTVNCLEPLRFYGVTTFTFTYHAASDTLQDQLGVVWHRSTVLSQGEPTLHGHCASGDFPGFDFVVGSASGTADVLWGDSCVSPGGAHQVRPASGASQLALIAASGQTLTQFGAITPTQLHTLTYGSSEFAVTSGSTFAVHTHGGKYAKVLVEQVMANLSVSDAVTYTFRFVTYAT